MSIVRTTGTLGRPVRPGLAIEVVALTGTGAMHLCLPQGVAGRLELNENGLSEPDQGATRLVFASCHDVVGSSSL